ncbi:MAG TPA: SAM-dependent methyltransferase [Chitinophagaceae bacterium]|nr:SAM-dependent methyltransferase [Chitinophagaceae bacterium]
MIYLIPSPLAEDSLETIPPYVLAAIKECKVIFAENERTARRFLKSMDKKIMIDDFEWYAIHKTEERQINIFRQKIKEQKNIAVISEAGCPGIADPGQLLVAEAQQMHVQVKPLAGPSSILLALMASGLNGQHFTFHGYLPVDHAARIKKIKQLEEESLKKKCTQLFIETPYRNDPLLKDILHSCNARTKVCIAAEITSSNEWIKTMTVDEWKKKVPSLHKRPVIFLLQA